MAYIDEVLADSPVLVLPMDEASGNLHDLVAAKTAYGAGTPTYGVTGPVAGHTAIVCDASGDYFALVDHADLDLADGPWTIEVWARRDTDTGGYEFAISKGTNGYALGVGGAGGAPIADKWLLTKDNVAVLSQSTASVPADGSWHQYVVTRSATRGAGSTIFYVDGTAGTVDTDTTTTLADTASALQLFRDEVGDPPFLGGLAYLAIYKSVLSPARIAAHYAAATAVDGPFPFVGGGYYA